MYKNGLALYTYNGWYDIEPNQFQLLQELRLNSFTSRLHSSSFANTPWESMVFFLVKLTINLLKDFLNSHTKSYDLVLDRIWKANCITGCLYLFDKIIKKQDGRSYTNFTILINSMLSLTFKTTWFIWAWKILLQVAYSFDLTLFENDLFRYIYN